MKTAISTTVALFLLYSSAGMAKESCSGIFNTTDVELVENLISSNELRESVGSKDIDARLNDLASEFAGKKMEVVDPKDVETKSLLKKIFELPGKAKASVGHIKELVRVYKQLRADVKAAMKTAELDAHLDAFRGFHHDMTDRHFDRRTWKPMNLDKITKDEVVGIDPEVFAKVAGFAMEVEAPTMPYSYSTGESFSNLFPKIGRFMGKDKNQKLYAEETNRRVCESAWCAEEERHAGFLAQIMFRLTGKMPTLANSNKADENARDERSAMSHLAERQTYEWNATSSYAFLMAHSGGHLREAMQNILKDEVKHLTIMSSAYTYIYGNRPWKRFSGILKNTLDIMKKHQGERTDSDTLTKDKMVVIKIVLTHLVVEAEMRKYLGTIPHEVLRDYFDSPSDLPKLGESGLSESQRQEIEAIRQSYVERRKNLEWWDKNQAAKMKEILSFSEANKEILNRIVQEKFSGFVGAEAPGSPAEQIVMSQIKRLISEQQYRAYFPLYIKDNVVEKFLPVVLENRLRAYQIRNNKYEARKKEFAEAGAKAAEADRSRKKEVQAAPVKKDQEIATRVMEVKSAAEGFVVVRVEKPQNLKLSVGSSVSFAIKNDSNSESRVLSLASSPDKNYFEFAVKTSDSNFKKKFASLKKGDEIYLTKQEHQLAFDTSAPMVMIATGIGITPFRSIIEYARDTKLQTPMWLLYGNRSEVPFAQEINDHTQNLPQLAVQHTLSQPGEKWTGAKGRIDKNMLASAKASAPANAKYYIVGNPEMIQETRATLLSLGVNDSQIIIEVFFAGKINDANKQKSDKKKLEEDEMICFCKRVTTGQILSEMISGKDFDSAVTCTGAGAGCGGCKGKIAAIKQCI